MKVGDIIEICTTGNLGALTAVKFFNRLIKKTGGLRGVVVADHGNSVSALFGENVIIVSKKHARVLDNRAKEGENRV
ncbi:MAG: hypothetical protein CMM76_13635 [Rhodospirillaceae bacterium]|nr:hypothetical protein [Rhodospirillaceae bacterium]|tara:strand:- start:520 stop:750 length:231 start_codon:yes stop_codon:yes gene_type:complete